MSGKPKTRRSPRSSPRSPRSSPRSPRSSPKKPPSDNYVKYPEDYNNEEVELFAWRKVELRKAQREGRRVEPLYYNIGDFRETTFASSWLNVDEQMELTDMRKREEIEARYKQSLHLSTDPGQIHRDEVNGIFLAPAYKEMITKQRGTMRVKRASDDDLEGAAY